MPKFICPRRGCHAVEDQPLATAVAHTCHVPYEAGDGSAGYRLLSDRREIGVTMTMVPDGAVTSTVRSLIGSIR